MRSKSLVAAALAAVLGISPVAAQDTLESTSNSGSVANSGSQSGAVSDQAQGQALTNANQLGQTASNQQGVSVSNTFNSTNHKRSYVGTNTAVPLAASSSFSSDYCGGTASGGASLAPIGLSIGGAAPTFDKSCQSLRRAERFGQAAANYHNLGYPTEAMKLMSLMVWSICTSDSAGPKADKSTAAACAQILDMGGAPQSADVMVVPVPAEQPAVTPLETQKPNVVPPTQYESVPVIQGELGANDNDAAPRDRVVARMTP